MSSLIVALQLDFVKFLQIRSGFKDLFHSTAFSDEMKQMHLQSKFFLATGFSNFRDTLFSTRNPYGRVDQHLQE